MRLLVRATSTVWILVTVGLGLLMMGSQLLSFAQPGRYALAAAAGLAGLAMLTRFVVPDHAGKTRWALPLIGVVSVSACLLTLFASEMSSTGFTPARVGYAILLLTPALFAYLHWVGERVMRKL